MGLKSINKIELMAPAGSFESLQAALDNGADSIYFGVEQLNMRARASINFTLDDLAEVSKRCTEKGVRSYLTLNTIIYDHDVGDVTNKLLHLQHHHHSEISSTTHIHVDEHLCLEVLVVQGTAKEVKKLADNIKAIKGIKHGELVITSRKAG